MHVTIRHKKNMNQALWCSDQWLWSKIGRLFEFQQHSIIIFQNRSSQTFPEIQFVRICFVFRMYILQTFVRDSKLSFWKHKTDIDTSRSWRLARGKPVRLQSIMTTQELKKRVEIFWIFKVSTFYYTCFMRINYNYKWFNTES